MTQNRDAHGYFTTGPARLDTDTYAFTARDLDIGVQGSDVAAAQTCWDTFGSRRRPTDAGTLLFVGIAPREDVDEYLSDVGHAEVGDIDVDPLRVTYLPHPGGGPAGLRWIAVGMFVVVGVVLAGGLALVVLALATRPRSSV